MLPNAKDQSCVSIEVHCMNTGFRDVYPPGFLLEPGKSGKPVDVNGSIRELLMSRILNLPAVVDGSMTDSVRFRDTKQCVSDCARKDVTRVFQMLIKLGWDEICMIEPISIMHYSITDMVTDP